MVEYTEGLNTGSGEPYYESAAIVVIVANSVSCLALVFVVGMYIMNWRAIASFPMRLVKSALQQVILSLPVLSRPEPLRHPPQSDHHS